MHTMQNENQSEPEVVDLAEVVDDIYAYELETVRRAAGERTDRPTPGVLTFEPQMSEFTD
jgi:hypothetical protein